MGTSAGSNVVTAQDRQLARQRHRAALRRKLNDLLALADGQYRAQQWSAFEDTKSAIRLVLADLAGAQHVPNRVMSRLPVTPSARRGGAGSEP